MKKLNWAYFPCLLIIMSILSKPALARDYSYMDDHASEGTASTSPAASAAQDTSILNSVIDAAVTTGMDSVDESMNKGSDSITGKFYRNFRNDQRDQKPQFRNRYEQDKYDREYRERNSYDREKQYPGKRKGWSDEKWQKERDKHYRKAQKKRNKSWKKEQKGRNKGKNKYYKKQKRESDREWREDEYERRREWEADRREYRQERNEANREYRREHEPQHRYDRDDDFEARERARKRYRAMQQEMESQ